MEREKDLTFLVHKLLNQQQRLKQLYNELKMEEHSEYYRTSANESETECTTDFNKRCAYTWIAGSEIDLPTDGKEYTDEDIEQLQVFRKTNFSECHNEGPFLIKASDSPPPKGSNWPETPSIEQENKEDLYYRIENYSLNYRLFPTLTSAPDDNGGHQDKNRLLQVSIPQTSSRETQFKFQPRTRDSFDSISTMGLSKHCLKGLKSTKYPVLPAQNPLSIKHHSLPKN